MWFKEILGNEWDYEVLLEVIFPVDLEDLKKIVYVIKLEWKISLKCCWKFEYWQYAPLLSMKNFDFPISSHHQVIFIQLFKNHKQNVNLTVLDKKEKKKKVKKLNHFLLLT